MLPGCWLWACGQILSVVLDPTLLLSKFEALLFAGWAHQDLEPWQPNPRREGCAQGPDRAVVTAERSIRWGWIFWVALPEHIGFVARDWNRKVSAGLCTVKTLSGFI